jgi:hypothetical protein
MLSEKELKFEEKPTSNFLAPVSLYDFVNP